MPLPPEQDCLTARSAAAAIRADRKSAFRIARVSAVGTASCPAVSANPPAGARQKRWVVALVVGIDLTLVTLVAWIIFPDFHDPHDARRRTRRYARASPERLPFRGP